jgi:hypothetical protein
MEKYPASGPVISKGFQPFYPTRLKDGHIEGIGRP